MSGEGGNKYIDIVDGTKAIAIIIIEGSRCCT